MVKFFQILTCVVPSKSHSGKSHGEYGNVNKGRDSRFHGCGRRWLSHFLFVCLTVLSCSALFADTEVVDGVAITYTVSDGRATIGEGHWTSIDTSTKGIFQIPV